MYIGRDGHKLIIRVDYTDFADEDTFLAFEKHAERVTYNAMFLVIGKYLNKVYPVGRLKPVDFDMIRVEIGTRAGIKVHRKCRRFINPVAKKKHPRPKQGGGKCQSIW